MGRRRLRHAAALGSFLAVTIVTSASLAGTRQAMTYLSGGGDVSSAKHEDGSACAELPDGSTTPPEGVPDGAAGEGGTDQVGEEPTEPFGAATTEPTLAPCAGFGDGEAPGDADDASGDSLTGGGPDESTGDATEDAGSEPSVRDADCGYSLAATPANGLANAIERVQANCLKNPQALGLRIALQRLVANARKHAERGAARAARKGDDGAAQGDGGASSGAGREARHGGGPLPWAGGGRDHGAGPEHGGGPPP